MIAAIRPSISALYPRAKNNVRTSTAHLAHQVGCGGQGLPFRPLQGDRRDPGIRQVAEQSPLGSDAHDRAREPGRVQARQQRRDMPFRAAGPKVRDHVHHPHGPNGPSHGTSTGTADGRVAARPGAS